MMKFGVHHIKICAKILIEFTNGTKREISTDDTLKVKNCKEVRNNIYDGEEIDFTKTDEAEKDVVISNETYNLILPIVEKEYLKPILYDSPKGEKILEFKQNMF